MQGNEIQYGCIYFAETLFGEKRLTEVEGHLFAPAARNGARCCYFLPLTKIAG
jgi:hypothetical protein